VVKLKTVFTADEFRKAVQFPVIVENWKKRDMLRAKRRRKKEFTDDEWRTIERWHNKKFNAWHLSTGMPDEVECSLATLELLTRACNFFASI
jgi:hypothetical protein